MAFIACALVPATSEGQVPASETASSSEKETNGFIDHGIAVPASADRGLVATMDDENRPVILSWLGAERRTYAMLMVDVQSGEAQTYPVPYEDQSDQTRASVLSSGNRFYSLTNNHFLEFDPVERAYTFVEEIEPYTAMAMAEAPDGTIWAATRGDGVHSRWVWRCDGGSGPAAHGGRAGGSHLRPVQ